MPLPVILTSLFSGKAKEIATNLTDGLDKIFTSKEEKLEAQLNIEKEVNRHLEEATKAAQAEIDAYLKDTQDARASFTKIQESEHSSWMAKNITPLLTIVVTVGFFGLLFYMLKYEIPKANERIFDIMLGSLGTAWITMVGFYFGSSISSKTNGEVIRKMAIK